MKSTAPLLPRPLAPLLLGALVALVVGAPLATFAGPASGPLATLRSYNERLDKLLRKKSESPVDRQAVKSLARELFDYQELARRSLAQHWDKLTKPQQDEFVRTLSEMMEKNYVKQLRSNLDYEVVYKDEAVTGAEATVATVVKVRTKGKSTDVSIDYKLRKGAEAEKGAAPTASQSDRWLVYDVITDEVSMVRNYRSQFNKIITNESYDALLGKMRKRIQDADADKPATAASTK